MAYIVSQRALVLHEMIRGIDHDIEQRESRGEGVDDLRRERKRLADECLIYLSQAQKATRKNIDAAYID